MKVRVSAQVTETGLNALVSNFEECVRAVVGDEPARVPELPVSLAWNKNEKKLDIAVGGTSFTFQGFRLLDVTFRMEGEKVSIEASKLW